MTLTCGQDGTAVQGIGCATMDARQRHPTLFSDQRADQAIDTIDRRANQNFGALQKALEAAIPR